ncbi:MoaD/ThiS family protein [Pelomonas sp. KK5]|uniref:MoaD/ThiS family protein n=1 Tax=Pelomonas sp. KK5 TaxID=1855730 RepID=UPI00097C9D15|nr:MoaD/ThiS family protein [Pelomonas sp. KK5]
MSVTIRYFASLREALGSSETFDWTPGLTVGSVRDRLLARGEPHASALARTRAVRCALNQQLAREEAAVADGAELAFFPPVTGG